MSALEIECVDRLYSNASVPILQVGGHVGPVSVRPSRLRDPSPALLAPIGNRFRRVVKAFADERGIPILQLKNPIGLAWDGRKLDTSIRPFCSEPTASAGSESLRSSPARSSSGSFPAATSWRQFSGCSPVGPGALQLACEPSRGSLRASRERQRGIE